MWDFRKNAPVGVGGARVDKGDRATAREDPPSQSFGVAGCSPHRDNGQ